MNCIINIIQAKSSVNAMINIIYCYNNFHNIQMPDKPYFIKKYRLILLNSDTEKIQLANP
jgi:hypothetical protein